MRGVGGSVTDVVGVGVWGQRGGKGVCVSGESRGVYVVCRDCFPVSFKGFLQREYSMIICGVCGDFDWLLKDYGGFVMGLWTELSGSNFTNFTILSILSHSGLWRFQGCTHWPCPIATWST